VPWLLPAAQWLMLAFELAAPLMLLVRSDRARVALVLFLIGFHVMVYAGVTIIFLPHCIAILSILPWGRLTTSGQPPALPRAAPPSRKAGRGVGGSLRAGGVGRVPPPPPRPGQGAAPRRAVHVAHPLA